MKKLLTLAATIMMYSSLLVSNAKAQDSSNPPPSPTPAPATQAPAAQPPSAQPDAKAPAAKKPDSKTPATKTPAAKASDSKASDSKGTAGKTPGDKTQSSAAGAAKTPVHHAAATPLVLNTEKDKRSYAIGMNIGKTISKNSLEVDPNIVARGLKDALTGGTPLMTEEEQKTVMAGFQADMRKKVEDERQQAMAKGKKESEEFLAANKAKEGVVTLPSGLQYKVLKEGSGPKPTPSDTVECNYKGTLIDGTEFDSTAKHGAKPSTFPVTGVIKGWTEALQLMPVGSKWQLVIPPDLAYGERGAGGVIPPNATLVFEIELVGIQPKPAAAPAK
jgi:FKBP-type peptidyl-prolyl cis-trans isomerase FklB